MIHHLTFVHVCTLNTPRHTYSADIPLSVCVLEKDEIVLKCFERLCLCMFSLPVSEVASVCVWYLLYFMLCQ